MVSQDLHAYQQGYAQVTAGRAMDIAEALTQLKADVQDYFSTEPNVTDEGLATRLSAFSRTQIHHPTPAAPGDLALGDLSVRVAAPVTLLGSTTNQLQFNISDQADRTTSYDVNLGDHAADLQLWDLMPASQWVWRPISRRIFRWD